MQTGTVELVSALIPNLSKGLALEGGGVEPLRYCGAGGSRVSDHVGAVGVAGTRASAAAVGEVGDGERHAGVPDDEPLFLPALAPNSQEPSQAVAEGKRMGEGSRDASPPTQIPTAPSHRSNHL